MEKRRRSEMVQEYRDRVMKTLTKIGFQKENIVSYGNMFLLANGRYGYRGTLEEFRAPEMVNLTVLAFYDRFGDKWREPINLPNPFYLKVQGHSLLENEPINHEVSLDIQHGVFARETEYEDLRLHSQRIVVSDQKNLLIEKYRLEATKDTTLDMILGMDEEIAEINGPHFQKKEFFIGKDSVYFKGTTNEGRDVSLLCRYSLRGANLEQQKDNAISGFRIRKFLKAQDKISLSMVCLISQKGEDRSILETELSSILDNGVEALWKRHRLAFSTMWDDAKVVIKGDKEAQDELDYSIYHLLILKDRGSFASVPARGLSGQTYKGAIFWDTEMFIMPFFLSTDPLFARNTLVYRIHTLEGAKKKAKKYGYEGAFFAWESQEDGTEQCSDYNLSDPETGAPIRTYFADRQIHISADVVMALDQYVSRTGDVSILREGGYRLIEQCCLFYQSYAAVQNGRLHFLQVIGPDEYHELVDDNAYTNYAIKKCFDIALKYYDGFSSGTEANLDKKALLSLADKIFLPKPNEEGVIEQFRGYFGLQDSTLEEVRAKIRNANEYLGGPHGVITPTKLIKQADVLSLLLVDPKILEGRLEENFDYYFPKTEHGSSLSSAVYSLAASRLGKRKEAYAMFRKSSGIDLGTNQKMYAGGIYIGGTHPASNAGAYLSAIFGFAGLTFNKGEPECVPSLPDSIQEISFKTYYQRRKFDIRVSRQEVRIKEDRPL